MSDDNKINVPMTRKQLEFIINKIHVDNSFRKYLADFLKQETGGSK